MTSLKTFFPFCLKVTGYITPKIQNVLMWDRPMQIWDTNGIENINGKHENFKLGSRGCQNSSIVHMKNPFVSEPNNSSQAFLQPNILKWILNQEPVTLNFCYYLRKSENATRLTYRCIKYSSPMCSRKKILQSALFFWPKNRKEAR